MDKDVRRALMVAKSLPREDNLRRFMGKSVAVDKAGKPLTVYRGEHGETESPDFQTRMPSLTFSGKRSADLYATEANVKGDNPAAPRVYPAHVRIENPVINDPHDPYIDFSHLEEKGFSPQFLRKMAKKHSEHITNTSNWQEDLAADDPGKEVGQFLAEHPQNYRKLYMLTFPLLDDPEFVSEAKRLGYDGAIHAGYGGASVGENEEEEDEPEYRVFDQRQAKSAIGNRGTFDPTDPDITKADGGSVAERRALMVAKDVAKAKDDAVTAASVGFPDSMVQHPVYHRTPKSFDKFRLGDDSSGKAIWFSPDPKNLPTGRPEDGERIIKAFVNAKNPLHLDEFNLKEMQDRWAKGSREFPFYLHDDTRDRLLNAGFDSVVSEDVYGTGDVNEMMVLHPDQVHIHDPDITKAKGGEVNSIGIPKEHAVRGSVRLMDYPYKVVTPRRAHHQAVLIEATNKAHRDAKPERLAISDLVTDQAAVDDRLGGSSSGPVFVERIGGVNHLRDGNHRVEAAARAGNSHVDALVADMDPVAALNERLGADITKARGGSVAERRALMVAKGVIGKSGGGGVDQEAGVGFGDGDDAQNYRFKVSDLISHASNYPVNEMDPSIFREQMDYRMGEDTESQRRRVEAADLQYPVITTISPITGQPYLLDGTHRAQKAIEGGLKAIKTRTIPLEEMQRYLVKNPPAEKPEGQHPASQIPGVHISERTHGKPIFTGERVGKADGGGIDIPNPMSVYPKPERKFSPEEFVPGGKFIRADTGEDVTGHKAAAASIVIAPGGKAGLTVSQDAVDQTGSPGRKSADIKANLIRKLGRWNWVDTPEGHEDTNNLVSIKHRNQHYYTLAAHFPKGADLARYPNEASEPKLKPTTVGNLELGPQIGSISTNHSDPTQPGGKRVHPVYAHIIAKADGGIVTGKDDDGEDGIIAYQGGPHSVGPEGYSNEKIGTGEGAHLYGYGHYFAEAEPVAQHYRDTLSPVSLRTKSGELLGGSTEAADYIGGKDRYRDPKGSRDLYEETLGYLQKGDTLDSSIIRMRRNFKDFTPPEEIANAERLLREHAPEKVSAGHMHQVRIQGRPEHFLDWDKPLPGQSVYVQAAMKSLLGPDWEKAIGANLTGGGVYNLASHAMRDPFIKQIGTPKEVSGRLSEAGIRGIRYLDQGSRNNYLVKDAPDGTANMTDRYGKVISNHPTRQEAHAAGKEMGSRNYVVFDPKHIDVLRRYARGGMAYADGGSTPDPAVQKALDLTRDLNPQGLYSHAAEAALASPQAKGPLPQMLASLKGVKPDELKYSGVAEKFAGQPRVTREDLAQHFQQSLPNIQEMTYKEDGDGADDGPTKYEEYTLPGGDNYREVLMRMDEKEPPNYPDFETYFKKNFRGHSPAAEEYVRRHAMQNWTDAGGKIPNYRGAENYESSHWDVPNVLAHLRLKDRTGPNGEKILHAEEIQSDWGQQARREGTYNSKRPYQVFETNTGKVLSEHPTLEEAAAESAKHRAAGHEGVDHGHVIDTQTDREPVPDAPYIGNTQGWTDLALKRLLHEAAAGGYDKVVWTPGAEQAKRYGKSDSKGMEGYYDKVVPKSLLALARQHDPEAKLEAHQVPGVKSPAEEKSSDHHRLEELAGGELSEAQVDAIRDYLINDREERGFVRPGAFEDALNHARRVAPHKPSEISFPGLTITPRMRESINKRGFKAYARGGEVEGYGRGGRRGSYHPDDDLVREALARTNMIGHNNPPYFEPRDERYHELMTQILDPRNPDQFEAAKRIAKEVYNVDDFSYSGFKKHPVLPSQVTTTISDIPGAIPKTPTKGSWHDFYRVGKGGVLFTLGGDRSNLGRLTHINGKQLAWPVDLHAGMKYMQEPNPGAVWANDLSAANALRNNILREADKGKEVFGAFAPMGTMSVDSSKNMTDAMMSHIAASDLDAAAIDEFDAKMRDAQHVYDSTPGPPAKKKAAQDKARERMAAWPGLRDPLACRDFAIDDRNMSGQHRSGMIKLMDKKKFLDAGFPSVGATRAAVTDPSLLHTPANMVGGNIVRLDPSKYDTKNLSFDHSTYDTPTSGELIMQVPFEARHDVLPGFIKEQLTNPDYVVKKGPEAGNPLLIHPYSPLSTGRSSFRGNTEMRQAAQPINEEMLESIEAGQERRKKYGFSQGGDAKKDEGKVPADKFASYKDPRGTPIDDWKWRPLPDVRAELGNITEIPSHVVDFGRFMDETAERAATQGLKARDLVKSYAITIASIQRAAREAEKVRPYGLPLEGLSGKIRPEGAMGEWLHTPAGQAYLDRAVRGEVHEPALADMMQKLTPFGMTNKLADALRWGAANLPGKEGLVSHLVAAGRQQASSPDEWRDFAKGLHGIDVSKAGFIASMLGRGDQPTFDARQRILQTGMTSTDAGKMIAGPKMNPKARAGVDRLAARQSAMDLALPKELAPYYQHLAHHTIWDKASGEETTHQDLIDAMRHAASGGAIEKSPIHNHPLFHIMKAIGLPGLDETGKGSTVNNNRSVVDEALRLTSQNGSPLPDAVNLARQHKPGRR